VMQEEQEPTEAHLRLTSNIGKDDDVSIGDSSFDNKEYSPDACKGTSASLQEVLDTPQEKRKAIFDSENDDDVSIGDSSFGSIESPSIREKEAPTNLMEEMESLKEKRKSLIDSDSENDVSLGDSSFDRDQSSGVASREAQTNTQEYATQSPEEERKSIFDSDSYVSESDNPTDSNNDDSTDDVVSSNLKHEHDKSLPSANVSVNEAGLKRDHEKRRVWRTKINRYASRTAIGAIQFRPKSFVKQRRERFHDLYQLGQLLGEGEFGEVFVGYPKEGGSLREERAIKVIGKERMCNGDYEVVLNEFNLLKGLTHPNILTLYGFYECDSKCYIVSELCKGGELWDELDARGSFEEADAAAFMTNLLSAVEFLQVHREYMCNVCPLLMTR
jgi:Protein kinase domain